MERTGKHSRETDPLLPADGVSIRTPILSEPIRPRTRCTWPWPRLVLLALLVGTVCCIGEQLFAAPRIRLIESVLCGRYYAQHDPSAALPATGEVPERLCKIQPVQDELATIMGGQFFFDSVPAILFPIPYGLVADKFGRKWILVVSCLGYALSYAWTVAAVGVFELPLRWVWFSSAFFVLGGGPTIGTYMLTTTVADVVPSTTRSTVFFYRYCTDLIAELITPPVTSYLMTRNIWIPLIGATLFQVMTIILCLVIPETAPWPTPVIDGVEVSRENLENAVRPTNGGPPTTDHNGGDAKDKKKGPFSFVTQNKTIATLILAFTISKVGRQSLNILLQYVSNRYGWKLSQAGLLLSLRAFVNIILYTVILPALAAWILRRVELPAIRDLLLARWSLLLLLLGSAVLALSFTPALMLIGLTVFTLGTGFPHAARSLMTSIAEAQNTDGTTSDIARLYGLVAVAEGVGTLIEAVGLSWALRVGLSLGRDWLGLPFGLAALLLLFVAPILFGIKIKHLG